MGSQTTFAFSGGTIARAEHLRGAKEQRALWGDPKARVMALWRGKPLVTEGQSSTATRHLAWLETTQDLLKDISGMRVFLGLGPSMNPLFCVDLSTLDIEQDTQSVGAFYDSSQQSHPALPKGAYFADLRAIMTTLSPQDAELCATASGILKWHEKHGFCANCGAKSAQARGGWSRDCTLCGVTHFPRTDPVAIMLITNGNSALVGRSKGWPDGFYSLLAGFMEPGETLETAVRREVFEESGIKVGDVRYLASQPWPFPASLMLACHGVALTQDIKVDTNELEDARWISREEMMRVFEGEHPSMIPAREGAIAHYILKCWLQDCLNIGGAF